MFALSNTSWTNCAPTQLRMRRARIQVKPNVGARKASPALISGNYWLFFPFHLLFEIKIAWFISRSDWYVYPYEFNVNLGTGSNATTQKLPTSPNKADVSGATVQNSQTTLSSAVFDLKKSMRSGSTDNELKNQLRAVVGKRAKDGFEAEANRKVNSIDESMSTIGG